MKGMKDLNWIRGAALVRWCLIGVAGLITIEELRSSVWLLAMGAAVISNILFVASESIESRFKFIASARNSVAYLDALAIMATLLVPSVASHNLWLLSIPLIIADSLVHHNLRRIFSLSGWTAAVCLAFNMLANQTWVSLAMSFGAVVVAGAFAAGLSKAQRREVNLSRRDQRLHAVQRVGLAFAESQDLRATMELTIKAAVVETGASCGYIMLSADESKGPLVTEVAYSPHGEFDFPQELDFGFGLSGYVAKMGQPVSVTDKNEDQSGFDGVTEGVTAAISVPLLTRGSSTPGRSAEEQVLGVMTLLSTHKADSFTADDMELLRTFAALVAVAVSNARSDERQHSTFVRTMQSLATALEARDEYTRGHSQRVCEVSLLIAERLGFGPEALEELRVGTVLHDIGKIGVPDAILNKRGRLTDDEFEIMKTHPVIGYEICRPLALSEGVLMIIRNHHEKLDGSGYPDGLKGGELPLSLRIVCVADAFDAMSSRRPYRGVMDRHTVMSEFSRGAGIQFDPVVVESLRDLLNSTRMQELYAHYWTEEEAEAA